MDLTELALMVGEVREAQKEQTILLTDFVSKYDKRLKPLEKHYQRSILLTSILTTLGGALWGLVTLKWMKHD